MLPPKEATGAYQRHGHWSDSATLDTQLGQLQSYSRDDGPSIPIILHNFRLPVPQPYSLNPRATQHLRPYMNPPRS